MADVLAESAAEVAVQGATVVCVTSGANMNFDRLRMVSELAGVGARREAMLATTIPEVTHCPLRRHSLQV